ncbi:MAG: thermonuclease family protein [Pseudomonadota bacterium]
MLLIAVAAHAEVRVIDGDSLQQGATVYRLNGIDAPERGQMCGSWACGQAATRALDRMVTGANVSCTAHGQDGYGRVIATCYANGRDLSAAMIEAGMAWAFVSYSTAYAADELVAREKAKGVFSGENAPP